MVMRCDLMTCNALLLVVVTVQTTEDDDDPMMNHVLLSSCSCSVAALITCRASFYYIIFPRENISLLQYILMRKWWWLILWEKAFIVGAFILLHFVHAFSYLVPEAFSFGVKVLSAQSVLFLILLLRMHVWCRNQGKNPVSPSLPSALSLSVLLNVVGSADSCSLPFYLFFSCLSSLLVLCSLVDDMTSSSDAVCSCCSLFLYFLESSFFLSLFLLLFSFLFLCLVYDKSRLRSQSNFYYTFLTRSYILAEKEQSDIFQNHQ